MDRLVPSGKKETFGDTAAVLSHYVCAVTARVNSRDAIAGLAENSEIPVKLTLSFRHGRTNHVVVGLPRSACCKQVINALDDWAHPMQILADMLTIEEVKGR